MDKRKQWMTKYEKLMRTKGVHSSNEDGSDINVPITIRKLIDELLPKMLFRFRPVSKYAIKDFVMDAATSCSAINFNDPFDTLPMIGSDYMNDTISIDDCREGLELIYKTWKDGTTDHLIEFTDQRKQELLENVRKNWTEEKFSYYRTHIEEWRKIVIEDDLKRRQDVLHYVQRSTFVSCFCESVSNMLLWSHYADSHKGFALGYDFRSEENKKFKDSLYPVVYSDEKFDAKRHIHVLQLSMDFGGVPVYGDEWEGDIKCSLFKSKEWEYEEEWRLMKVAYTSDALFDAFPIKPICHILRLQNKQRGF